MGMALWACFEHCVVETRAPKTFTVHGGWCGGVGVLGLLGLCCLGGILVTKGKPWPSTLHFILFMSASETPFDFYLVAGAHTDHDKHLNAHPNAY